MRARPLATVVFILTLLLAAALLAGWGLSYRFGWVCGYFGQSDRTGISRSWYSYVGSGRWTLVHLWQNFPRGPTASRWSSGIGRAVPDTRNSWLYSRSPMSLALLGFALEHLNHNASMGWYSIEIPFWFLCAVALAAAGWQFRRLRRLARPPGGCPQCGYDLRATPLRCPECGWLAPAPVAAA